MVFSASAVMGFMLSGIFISDTDSFSRGTTHSFDTVQEHLVVLLSTAARMLWWLGLGSGVRVEFKARATGPNEQHTHTHTHTHTDTHGHTQLVLHPSGHTGSQTYIDSTALAAIKECK